MLSYPWWIFSFVPFYDSVYVWTVSEHYHIYLIVAIVLTSYLIYAQIGLEIEEGVHHIEQVIL